MKSRLVKVDPEQSENLPGFATRSRATEFRSSRLSSATPIPCSTSITLSPTDRASKWASCRSREGGVALSPVFRS